MDYKKIQVECYSGFKINERPMAFTYQGRRREIQDIIDPWQEGDMNSTRPEINKYPPAEPEVLRLLAPQRGLIAIV
jgi:hypothetical protein